MITNVGSTDRVLRLIAGVLIFVAGFYFKTWWGLLGFLPLLTAVFRFCPAYPLLGISTSGRDKVN